MVEGTADGLVHDPLPGEVAVAIVHSVGDLRALPVLIDEVVVVVEEELADPEEGHREEGPFQLWQHDITTLVIIPLYY